ncbi:hypothetical protein [Kitasatospora sp. NPDC059571]
MVIVRSIQSWLSDETFLELASVATGAAILWIGCTYGALSLLSR